MEAASAAGQWKQEAKRLQKELQGQSAEKKKLESLLAVQAADFANKMPPIFDSAPLLRNIATWLAVPHPCGAVALTTTVREVSDDLLRTGKEFRATELSQAWQDRHTVIETDGNEAEARKTASRCFLRGLCLCHGRGRVVSLMWTRAQASIKAWMRDSDNKTLFKDGFACLQWQAFHLHHLPNLLNGQMEECQVESEAFTYVAVQRLSPWDQTYLALDTDEGPRDAQARTLKLRPQEQGVVTFLHPPGFLNNLDVEVVWVLACWSLSTRHRPFPDSMGKVRVERTAMDAKVFWQGQAREMRRARHAAAVPPVDVDIAAAFADLPAEQAEAEDEVLGGQADEEVEFGSDLEALWLASDEEAQVDPQQQPQQQPEPQQAQGNADSSSSTSTSGSSSDSSSSSSSDSDGSGRRPAEPAEPEPAEPEGREAVNRRRHERTHTFGRGFLMTWKAPATWQCTCYYHNRHERTKCKKSLVVARGGGADASAETLRRLQFWAVSGALRESRAAHQGGRGLPALNDEEAGLTHDQLCAMERALPAPPP